MDKYLSSDGFSHALHLLEAVNRSTDDYLFLWDMTTDRRWFFGDIDEHYDIRSHGSATNSTQEMLRIIYPPDRPAVLESLQAIAAGKKTVHDMDYRWVNRQGRRVWINCHGTVIPTPQGQNTLMLGRVSEEKLRHLYNPLTGLWNKNRLLQDLQRGLPREGGQLMLLDINSLSSINLSHGRAYGDRLLQEVAACAEGQPEVRTAYNIDRNYFALHLDLQSEDGVRQVYRRICDALKEKCTFTASVVPMDSTLFSDGIQLMDAATMTMKTAKSLDRSDRIAFFSRQAFREQLQTHALLEELKESVEQDFAGFSLHYQPQVRTGDYQLYGVEALLRYESKTQGKVFPDQFIPLLEQSRLISRVGMWVLETALRQCKKWRKALPELRVSVNFSATQFDDTGLGERVVKLLRSVGISGSALTMEITESAQLQHTEDLESMIRHLKAYGVRFAIDDFGTGYSNLSHLKRLDIDEIKIDRMFVSGIEPDTYNHKLISNIVEFARANAIGTCCEGVETARELMILELLQPDLIQGYLFDRPAPPEELESVYIDEASPRYQQRIAFLQQLFAFRERMGLAHFDPKEILRENEVGLWMMRIHPAENRYTLQTDPVMARAIAADSADTPDQCYSYWFSRIHPDYVYRVQEGLEKMMHSSSAVQLEFPWLHPTLGDVMLRFSGKRAEKNDSTVTLAGYQKMITDVAGA